MNDLIEANNDNINIGVNKKLLETDLLFNKSKISNEIASLSSLSSLSSQSSINLKDKIKLRNDTIFKKKSGKYF